ncbi:MAG: hypothetical protein Q8K85_12960, partial [Hyphomicrobium sp.]|nr:hypothetical protein [Hyphomicrobium sp.]
MGAAHAFDAAQRVAADRGVAGHGAGGEVDRDARMGGGVAVVGGEIIAAAALDRIVAAAAIELLEAAILIVAAAQRIAVA